MKIDMSDLDAATVLQALYANAKTQLAKTNPSIRALSIKVDDCQSALRVQRNDIGTLGGIKILVSFTDLSAVDCDRYNGIYGKNAAQNIVEGLRRKKRRERPKKPALKPQPDSEIDTTLAALLDSSISMGQSSHTASGSHSTAETIDISGLDQLKVIYELYTHAWLNHMPIQTDGSLTRRRTEDEFRQVVQTGETEFEEIWDVSLELSTKDPRRVNVSYYNLFYGKESAESIVADLRSAQAFVPSGGPAKHTASAAISAESSQDPAFGQASNTARRRSDMK